MRRLAFVLFSTLGLAACAGGKWYSNDGAKNLTVRTQVESSVRANLHVSRVAAGCDAEYQGRVSLDRPTVEVSLPTGQLGYLDVSFDTSSFLAGKRSMSAGTLVRPRAGYRYELVVNYRGDIYNVTLREIGPNNTARELPRRDLWNCASAP